MRLTEAEILAIKAAILSKDNNAKVFLFGSRSQDHERGGDIDLLIESTSIGIESKRSLLVAIKEKIGFQKVDLLFSKSIQAEKDPFINSIKGSIIKL